MSLFVSLSLLLFGATILSHAYTNTHHHTSMGILPLSSCLFLLLFLSAYTLPVHAFAGGNISCNADSTVKIELNVVFKVHLNSKNAFCFRLNGHGSNSIRDTGAVESAMCVCVYVYMYVCICVHVCSSLSI